MIQASTANGTKTSYLIDSNRPYAQVLEEYEDENLKFYYAQGLDLISVEQDGEVSIYQVDGLGSTPVLTDLDGNVVADYNYEAFGELLDSTGDVENDYLFAGEQFDGDLGQYYLRDRYYDQNIGRFTRRDVYEGRLRESITLHKYLYGNANPVSFIDPTGLSSRFASSDKLGYAVEEHIENEYAIEFSGDNLYFGSGYGEPSKGIGVGKDPKLEPDIGNYTRKTYNEIKPFNPGGYSKGKRQMKKYRESLESEGWTPNQTWKAPPLIGGPVQIEGRNIIYFNDFDGLIFYTDQTHYYPELVKLGSESVKKRTRTSTLRKMREGKFVSGVGLNTRAAINLTAGATALGAATLIMQVMTAVSLTRGFA